MMSIYSEKTVGRREGWRDVAASDSVPAVSEDRLTRHKKVVMITRRFGTGTGAKILTGHIGGLYNFCSAPVLYRGQSLDSVNWPLMDLV